MIRGFSLGKGASDPDAFQMSGVNHAFAGWRHFGEQLVRETTRVKFGITMKSYLWATEQISPGRFPASDDGIPVARSYSRGTRKPPLARTT